MVDRIIYKAVNVCNWRSAHDNQDLCSINFRFPALKHYIKAQGRLSLKETILAVLALRNVEHMKKYRRPYAAGLWIGSMSGFSEDYECTVTLN